MTLTIDLRDEQGEALKAKAQAQGVSAEEYLRQMVDRELEAEKPIWEVIADNMKDVPPEAWDSLPKDGLQQIDHYVYGVPKRELWRRFSPIRSTGPP